MLFIGLRNNNAQMSETLGATLQLKLIVTKILQKLLLLMYFT